MIETNGAGSARKLAVYAVVEKEKNGERKSYWTRIGAAFTNRDGSITLFLSAFPIGTDKLQVREPKEDERWGPQRPAPFETVEARP